MDRVRQMEVFVQVMETGNFTRAAAALAMPRSSVSTIIQALEDRLVAPLFNRSTRSMTPTDEARRLLPRAREIVDGLHEAEAMFAPGTATLTGRLRIGVPARIGRRLVVPALPSLLDAHPGLTVELSSTDRKAALIAEGFDCLLRVGALQDAEIVCRKLGDLPLVTCASPGYLARHGTPTSAADLSGHVLVSFTSSLPTTEARGATLACARPGGIAMRSRLNVSNSEAYIAAGRAGLGLIQVPAYDVRPLLASGELVAVLPNLAPPPMQLSLLYAQRRNVPRRVRVFERWIGGVMAKAKAFEGAAS